MEREEPKSPSRPEDSPLHEYSAGVAENVVDFQQFIDDVSEALEQDESFNVMTAKSYARKKSYIVKKLSELSSIHTALAEQFGYLIEDVSAYYATLTQNPHLESSDSDPPQDTQTLAPRFSTATGYDLLLKKDGGGFYLSKSTVKKPAIPPVNDDDKDSKALLEKISNLEEEVASLKRKNESLTVENDELKMEIEENIADDKVDDKVDDKDDDKAPKGLLGKISKLEQEVASLKRKNKSLTVENRKLKKDIEANIADMRLYMSKSKREYKTMENGFNESREIVKKLDGHLAGVIAEKIANQLDHESEMKAMNVKVNQYMTEIAQLKATHEKKEKIWKGVTGQLRQELTEKSALIGQQSEQMSKLSADKSSQNTLIDQLKTELDAVKSENARVIPSFDNVQKLIDELKLKVAELDSEVEKQVNVKSNKE
ncbi:peroxisomal and mitochondrial division factor 1-like [Helianthus annuus]|uniref:peroxisomal and mitochondrial division factor 1-like n=1 Tax=Helianthus annuus TaxID=4232 RepID=UPI001653338D|nr:peroxisomal and mitochondrial division factor 1-like [Helianthus annuus]